MKIAINGTNGFVGKYLCEFLKSKNHDIVVIKREIYNDISKLSNTLDGAEAVINLAGANISKKWSKEYKNELYQSRIKTTKNLVKAIINTPNPPKIFISTSAIGIYKASQDHDENSDIFDDGFLGILAKEWEAQALKAKEAGIKVAIFRLGVVLGNDGALGKILPIFKFGLGGILGNGEQGFSWVDIQDLARAYEFVLSNNKDGIYNLTSPNPITNKTFTIALAKTINRPALFRVPNFILKIKFGEGATILLEGSKVYPAKLISQGFKFKYERIEYSLANLLGKN